MMELIHSTPCLIFGCGNPLFGDDGFGPGVIEHLELNHRLPAHAACIDAGTGVRDILFDILLSEKKPSRILIIDASSQEGRSPGEISEIDIENISPEKTSDFSLHQFPTANMLKELRDSTEVDVRVLVVEPENIPDEIRPGISAAVSASVPEMCRRIMDIVTQETS
ncbi:MAG: hydrogenase maturation protease [Thermodesulfobacteriota bacterium]